MENLRKFRVNLEQFPFLNSKNNGVAIFDVIGTFLIGYMLYNYFKLETPLYKYFILLIFIGILVHLLVNQETFLNNKLFSSSFNIYQVLMIILIFLYLKK